MVTNLPSCFSVEFLELLLKFLVNFTFLKYVKSQRSYGFLFTKELILGFQISDLKNHFSASLKSSLLPVFFNLNVAKFRNLRLLLNRCQSLYQKGFVCVLIKLSYETCSSMLHLKMAHTAKLFSNFHCKAH